MGAAGRKQAEDGPGVVVEVLDQEEGGRKDLVKKEESRPICEDQPALVVFDPDLAVTPAGTYSLSGTMRIRESMPEPVLTCRGLVVSTTDNPERRPRGPETR